jgi:hypothetical protein
MTTTERTLWRRLEAQASATREQAACDLEIATRQAERVAAERDDAEGGTK